MSNNPTASAPLRLGLIGLGQAGRGQFMSAADVPEIEIVAIAEAGPLLDFTVPEGVTLHTDWRTLLEQDGIDAISLCLPHHMHTEVALAALESGRHLLVEKPLADTVADGLRIAEMAMASKRTLMVEMTHHFYPAMVEAHALVRSGKLGRIFAAEDRIIQWYNPVHMPQWIAQKSFAGGGVALTNGIHMIDRVAWLCGQPLSFVGGVAGWSHQQGDIEDTASLQLALADGTPVAILAAWPKGSGPLDDELTLYGTEGILRVWAWRGWRFEHIDGRTEEKMMRGHRFSGNPGMSAALSEFAAAVRERREPSVSTAGVLAAQEIIEAFYRFVGM